MTGDSDDKLNAAKQRWEDSILTPVVKNRPERSQSFETDSEIPVERVYLPSRSRAEYLESIGFPGQYPYTRGVHPTMYRGRLWTMRQYAGYASAAESNARYRYLLEQGQTGLSVAFDLPTQIGYDADDPHAEGEVGKVGVSISSLQDMMQLFDGIPLDEVSTSMTINAPAAILLAMYVATAKRQGVAVDRLRGTIQNDILKEYIARGTYIFPPEAAMRLITDSFRFCKEEIPQWNTISVSGYHIREAGSTAVQEVAFTLANAIAYLNAAVEAGMTVDDVAPQMAFFFNAHNDFLEEVAKFRAARRLWAKITRDRFQAQNPRSWMLRFHTQTAGSTLTAQQPENNIVRVALQALAAVLGGTQSLHTNSMDEALGLPTEAAVQVALRTQQIIAHESGVSNTVDPVAGAGAIEELTNEIEARVSAYLDDIDAMGGALPAIQTGFFQREIQQAAYQNQLSLENEEKVVVGVNAYQVDESIHLERHSVDPAVEEQQRHRLEELRKNRDNTGVQQALQQIRQAAQGTDNLMPVFIRAVESDVTLGEMCGTLREIWGEYRAPKTI